MKEILFLAHRIPYPPNKGDKIRSTLQISVGVVSRTSAAFVDDRDWRYVPMSTDLRRNVPATA